MFTDQSLQESRCFGVKHVPLLRPLGWLARGWADLRRCPGLSLLQGLMLALPGALLLLLARHQFWLLAVLFSVFLLLAPILATGFYALSRDLAEGRPVAMKTLLRAWQPQDNRLVKFGLLLALSGIGWILCSAALITGFAPAPINGPADFIRWVVLSDDSLLFPGWLALGALLAAPMFASSVVTIPILLDRRISVMGAVLTSWRVVMAHPAPLALWASLLIGLTLLGMASLMLGLVVILPWLGHASWHAYRDLVSMRD